MGSGQGQWGLEPEHVEGVGEGGGLAGLRHRIPGARTLVREELDFGPGGEIRNIGLKAGPRSGQRG